MPVVRDGNAKRVDVTPANQITKVIVLRAVVVAVVLVYLFNCGTPPPGIDVAYDDYPAIILLQKSLHVPHSHTSQADKTHRYSLARGRLLAPAEGGGGDNIRCGNSRCGAFYKSAAMNSFHC
jgi:hypothetical protein